MPVAVPLPQGFSAHVANIGIKDSTDDFVVIATDAACPVAAVFTQSSFSGPSVVLSRRNLRAGRARAVVVVSKNANVATGPIGMANAEELVAGVATRLGCAPQEVLVASTGVIGRQYPMDQVRAGFEAIAMPLPVLDATAVATAMMTTDTVLKVASAQVVGSTARIVGVAKGVGMIEPDMATLITLYFTDAAVARADLDAVFRSVMDRTFNCVSVDTDTSTSDTAIVLANGAAGAVDPAAFEGALYAVAESLTKQVARDGEGATKLLEVVADGAASPEQAKRIAKAIVNSPLVKTAVHGADPNWGRVAMAIGKASTTDEIDQALVVIRFGDQEVYPAPVDESGLDALATYMQGDDVRIHVSLGAGEATATVWGCDLSDGYIRINADYTT
ncbi:MAG: bifunctional glutamate N-acetyltransferase/amino-acid acetyltransferase ArgJ [Ilumatobacteraceae bacterium]